MEKVIVLFSFNIMNDESVVCQVESRNHEITKCDILDDRFMRILNFLLGEQTYEDIIFFLKSRTLLDAPRSNLTEIYESIGQSQGKIWTDPLSVEFVTFIKE